MNSTLNAGFSADVLDSLTVRLGRKQALSWWPSRICPSQGFKLHVSSMQEESSLCPNWKLSYLNCKLLTMTAFWRVTSSRQTLSSGQCVCLQPFPLQTRVTTFHLGKHCKHSTTLSTEPHTQWAFSLFPGYSLLVCETFLNRTWALGSISHNKVCFAISSHSSPQL